MKAIYIFFHVETSEQNICPKYMEYEQSITFFMFNIIILQQESTLFWIKLVQVTKDSSRCSSNTCADVSKIIRKKLSQTKITNFGGEVNVKENIASFNVSVHYRGFKLFMKICKTPGNAYTDSRSHIPIQLASVSIQTQKERKKVKEDKIIDQLNIFSCQGYLARCDRYYCSPHARKLKCGCHLGHSNPRAQQDLDV